MQTLSSHLQQIEEKIRKLVEQNTFLKEKCNELAEAKNTLHQQLTIEREKLKTTQTQSLEGDISKGQQKDYSKLKKQIDQNVQEIDQCIEWIYKNQ